MPNAAPAPTVAKPNLSLDAYGKRVFTPAVLAGDARHLLVNGPALQGALRNREIGRSFAERIMLVVTAVNGCTYCSWFHAKQAAASGLSEAEIRDAFNLQFGASASAHELPALLYAQHYAETNRRPEPEMTAQLYAFYGDKTARDIELLIRMIYFGNLFGNTFDALPSRVRGRAASGSSAPFELAFYLGSAWFMLPLRWRMLRDR